MSGTEHFNKVVGIFGRRGSGKTEFFKGNDQLGLRGLIRPSLQRGKKFLIVDTIDHPSYRDIPQMFPEQLHRWKKGVYRIWVRPDEMPALNKLINELPSMWNTDIGYEDAYKHQSVELDKSIVELIIDSKQKNIDMFFFYHTFSMAPKGLFRLVDYIELFKTKEHPKVRKDDMIGYYDDAVRIFNEVSANPSPFFHRTINTEL